MAFDISLRDGSSFGVALAASVSAISGSATITFSQSASIRGIGDLSGASVITFSQSAVLKGKGKLSGINTILFSPEGTLTGFVTGFLQSAKETIVEDFESYEEDSEIVGQGRWGAGIYNQPSGVVRVVDLNKVLDTSPLPDRQSEQQWNISLKNISFKIAEFYCGGTQWGMDAAAFTVALGTKYKYHAQYEYWYVSGVVLQFMRMGDASPIGYNVAFDEEDQVETVPNVQVGDIIGLNYVNGVLTFYRNGEIDTSMGDLYIRGDYRGTAGEYQVFIEYNSFIYISGWKYDEAGLVAIDDLTLTKDHTVEFSTEGKLNYGHLSGSANLTFNNEGTLTDITPILRRSGHIYIPLQVHGSLRDCTPHITSEILFGFIQPFYDEVVTVNGDPITTVNGDPIVTSGFRYVDGVTGILYNATSKIFASGTIDFNFSNAGKLNYVKLRSLIYFGFGNYSDYSDNFEGRQVGELAGQGEWIGNSSDPPGKLYIQEIEGTKVAGTVNDTGAAGFILHDTNNFRFGARIVQKGYDDYDGVYIVAGFNYGVIFLDINSTEIYINNGGTIVDRSDVILEGDVFEIELIGGTQLTLYLNGVVDTEWGVGDGVHIEGDNGVYTLLSSIDWQGDEIVGIGNFNGEGIFDDFICLIGADYVHGVLHDASESFTSEITGEDYITFECLGNIQGVGRLSKAEIITFSQSGILKGKGKLSGTSQGSSTQIARLEGKRYAKSYNSDILFIKDTFVNDVESTGSSSSNGGNGFWFSTTFVPTVTGLLKAWSTKCLMSNPSPSYDFDVIFKLYSTNAQLKPQTELATLASYKFQDFKYSSPNPEAKGWKLFTFSNPQKVSVGTRYAVVLVRANVPSNTHSAITWFASPGTVYETDYIYEISTIQGDPARFRVCVDGVLGVLAGKGRLTGQTSFSFTNSGHGQAVVGISGGCDILFSESADLNGIGGLVGSTTIAFAEFAIIEGFGRLSVLSSIQFIHSADIAGKGRLYGASDILFSLLADLNGAGKLSEPIYFNFSNSGNLKGKGRLSVTSVNIVISVSATIKGRGSLSRSMKFGFIKWSTYNDDFESYPEGLLPNDGFWDANYGNFRVIDDSGNKVVGGIFVEEFELSWGATTKFDKDNFRIGVRAKVIDDLGYIVGGLNVGAINIYIYYYGGWINFPGDHPDETNRSVPYSEGDFIELELKDGKILTYYCNGEIDTLWEARETSFISGDVGVYTLLQPINWNDDYTIGIADLIGNNRFDDFVLSTYVDGVEGILHGKGKLSGISNITFSETAYIEGVGRLFGSESILFDSFGDLFIVLDIVVENGFLYNWYAVDDARNIANTGWHIPTKAEFETLSTYLGGDAVAGHKLREIGTAHWDSPNIGATNEVGFNARGSGLRYDEDSGGGFDYLKVLNCIWSSEESINNYPWYLQLAESSPGLEISEASNPGDIGDDPKNDAASVRLIKGSTNLSNGQKGFYIGNDGKVYRTICIGTKEWLADNLCETKYRNLDSIPEIAPSNEWAVLTSGARCIYEIPFITTARISGDSNLSFSINGNIRVLGILSSLSNIVFSENGLLVGVGKLYGDFSVVFSQEGILYGKGRLNKIETITFSQVAVLKGKGELFGDLEISFISTGDIVDGTIAPTALVGEINLIFNNEALLRGKGQLVGVSNLIFSYLTNFKGKGRLVGAIGFSFLGFGVSSGFGRLAGSINAVASTFSYLKGKGKLQGYSNGSTSLEIIHFAEGELLSIINGLSSVFGILKGVGKLVGFINTISFVSSSLKGRGRLITSSTITFSQSLILKGRGRLVSSSILIFNQAAGIQGKGKLQGYSNGSTSLEIIHFAEGELSGIVDVISVVFGNLKGYGRLSGSGDVISFALASIKGKGRLVSLTTFTFSETVNISGRGRLSVLCGFIFSVFGEGILSRLILIQGYTDFGFILDDNVLRGIGKLQGVTSGYTSIEIIHFAEGELVGSINVFSNVSGILNGTGVLFGSSSVEFDCDVFLYIHCIGVLRVLHESVMQTCTMKVWLNAWEHKYLKMWDGSNWEYVKSIK